jgi:hypothetical protein
MTILEYVGPPTILLNSLPKKLHDTYIFYHIMTYAYYLYQLVLQLSTLTTIIMTTAIIIVMNGRKLNT